MSPIRSHQGSPLQRVLTADHPIPNQVLGIPVVDDQAQMEIFDPLDRRGELWNRRQRLTIVQERSFARTSRSGSQRRKLHTAELLQSLDTHVGRTQARFPFSIIPLGQATEVLEQLLTRRWIEPHRAGRDSLQQRLADPSSRNSYCVQHPHTVGNLKKFV